MFMDSVRETPGIIDSTLREGEQVAGVGFSYQQKTLIVKKLLELGIDEIELGVAADNNSWLPSLVKEVGRFRGPGRTLSLWCRCKAEDIDFAAQCGVDILSLSMPVSDLHIEYKLRRDRKWVVDTLVRSVKYAFTRGFRKVSVGLEDATRADGNFLQRCVSAAAAAGAMRIRLADTVGIATPGTMTALVKQVRSFCSLPVGVHTHNDFGMATANAMAAIETGASWADATVLGLGERCGNCRLEELIGYLSLVGGHRGYRPEKLIELCNFVASAAKRTISRHHPIIGDQIFTCETGLHVHGLTENPSTYEPYNPQRVGGKRMLRYGEKTGRKAILSGLAAGGIQVSEHEAAYLVSRLKRFAGQEHESLNTDELVNFARQIGVGRPMLGEVA